jgi:hypothetical protein
MGGTNSGSRRGERALFHGVAECFICLPLRTMPERYEEAPVAVALSSGPAAFFSGAGESSGQRGEKRLIIGFMEPRFPKVSVFTGGARHMAPEGSVRYEERLHVRAEGWQGCAVSSRPDRQGPGAVSEPALSDVSLRRIASAAGVSTGSIYKRFDTRRIFGGRPWRRTLVDTPARQAGDVERSLYLAALRTKPTTCPSDSQWPLQPQKRPASRRSVTDLDLKRTGRIE